MAKIKLSDMAGKVVGDIELNAILAPSIRNL